MKNGLLKGFIISLSVLVLSSLPVYAQWWNTSWLYRIPITIQENSGNNLTNYQVNLTINTQALISAGKMRPDCGDIRFTYYNSTSGTETEIPYWIESGCNTTSTNIWVKVPYIPANGNVTIYMYYGNPNAISESNPRSVFYFYEDWESGSINTTIWTVTTTGTAGVTNTAAYQGNYSFYTNLGKGQSTTLSTNTGVVSCPMACMVSFYWYMPTAKSINSLSFLIDGTTKASSTAAITSWTLVSVTNISSGTHNLTWSASTQNKAGASLTAYIDYIIVRGYASVAPSVTLGQEQSYVYITVNNYGNTTWNVSSSVESKTGSSSVSNVLMIALSSDNLTASIINNPLYPNYTCSISPSSVSIAPAGSYTFNVSCVPSMVATLNPSSLVVYASSYNTSTLSLTINDPSITSVSFSCSAPSGLTCTISPNSLSSNGTVAVNISASQSVSKGTYQITVTATSNTGVTLTQILTVNVNQVEVYFTSNTPSNGTNLTYLYLPIEFYTSTSTVNIEINGVNYTLTVNPNSINDVELYYTYSNPSGLPSLQSLVGSSGGSVSFRVYAIGPVINSTELRTVYLPPLQFYVNYTSPTPNNGTTSNVWLLQVAGGVVDNTLSQDYCYLELLNPNTSAWDNVSYLPNCNGYIYNGNLQAYANNTGTNYEVWYRIVLVNSQGLNYTAPAMVVYYSYNSQNVTIVNSSMSPQNIAYTIYNAIANGSNYIVFAPGSYGLDLIINTTRSVTFLGTGATLQPLSIASPVITVLNGNVTLDSLTISSPLFALRVDNGNLTIENSNINSGLYAIQTTSNSTVSIENSNIYGKVAGIYAVNGLSNSYIYNSTISSNVWGIYLNNAYNVVVNYSGVSAQVFGVVIDGNSTNNMIENTSVSAKIFGIYIKSGENNTINGSLVNSQIFGIKIDSGNNTIENTVINNGGVFGIYSLADNTIENVTVYGGIFGAYMTGNAQNLNLYGTKLGIDVFGGGYIENLSLDSGDFSIQYNGSVIIRSASGAPSVIGQYVFEGNQMEILGSINANITFVTNLTGNLSVIRIVGGLYNVISDTTTFTPQGYGIYGLYMG